CFNDLFAAGPACCIRVRHDERCIRVLRRREDRNGARASRKVSKINRLGGNRQTSFPQRQGISFHETSRDFTSQLAVAAKIQYFLFTMPVGQIRSVCSNHFEPSLTQELTEPSCA